MSKDELLAGILQLPPRERQVLIHEAMDSLPDEYLIDPIITPEVRAMLDARLKDMKDNPGDELNLEEALAELDRRQEERAKSVVR